jgi:hypothetical protein
MIDFVTHYQDAILFVIALVIFAAGYWVGIEVGYRKGLQDGYRKGKSHAKY